MHLCLTPPPAKKKKNPVKFHCLPSEQWGDIVYCLRIVRKVERDSYIVIVLADSKGGFLSLKLFTSCSEMVPLIRKYFSESPGKKTKERNFPNTSSFLPAILKEYFYLSFLLIYCLPSRTSGCNPLVCWRVSFIPWGQVLQNTS